MATFKDSIKLRESQTSLNTDEASNSAAFSLNAQSVVEDEDNAGIATLASDDNEWIKSTSYTWYPEYLDDKAYSIVDSQKNVTVNKEQINLTQEKNSQIISFQMPRFSDGIDIVNAATINFHIVNADNNDYMVPACNVSYNGSYIRFNFLVDEYFTAVKGNLKFEIVATGTTSAGEYVWRTKPNSEITILESLSGNGTIEPTDGWDSYITIITNKVSEAQQAALEASEAAYQAESAVASAQNIIDNAKTELQGTVDDLMADALGSFYNKSEIDEMMSNIDLQEVYDAIDGIDGLKALAVEYNSQTGAVTFKNGDEVIYSYTNNPTSAWSDAFAQSIQAETQTEINEVSANITKEINEYKATVDGKLAELEQSVKNIDVSDKVYLKDEVDTKLSLAVSGLNSSINEVKATATANADSIGQLGTKISELSDKVGNGDTEEVKSYYATYNSSEDASEDEKYKFSLWEVTGNDTENPVEVSSFKIVGGGGGQQSSSTMTIKYITTTPVTSLVGGKVVLKYHYSSVDSTNVGIGGTATWKVGSTVVGTQTLTSDTDNEFDISDYVSLGTQKVLLSITDDNGTTATRQWTVQLVDVHLESSFTDTFTYPIGTINFSYTPYGSISKEIHFILDGKELPSVTTSSSGIPMSYTLPSQEHGSHLLETYITATVNGTTIETDHLYKDIIWYDETSDVPVISCSQVDISAMQYDTTSIVYTVYDPKTETPKIALAVDGVVTSNLTISTNTNTWAYKTSDVGEHVLTITCRDTVKTIRINIEELDIDVEPVTAGLAFDFNPDGKSNNDDDRLWSDGDVKMTVSDNFDWTNGGYQIDDNGDQYFCVKAGTKAAINYKLFSDDAKRNGKEFKLIFKVTNVRNADCTFLSCMYNNVGLYMKPHYGYVCSTADSLEIPYCEEDIIEFEFNINKDTDIPMVMSYEDGVGLRPMLYTSDHSFTQDVPDTINIGSDDCDVLIYRMKAYSSSLTDTGILNNFIADARNAEEMISRYNRNQIYDENNNLTPDSIAEACPDLRIIKIDAPHFTNNKSDKVTNTTIEYIYKNGDAILDNWTATNAGHSGQGTTSNEYGAAGRNMDLIMNYSDTKIILGDGVTEAENGKISLTRNSVPVNYLNIKVNIASSENANNPLLQKRYNRYLPYQSVAMANDSRVKNDMEFYNCVVFIRENDSDVSTHREFSDCDWHFYAIGNVGDSKKTDNTRVNDAKDPKEFVVEILDNTLHNSTFQDDDEALDYLDADLFDESGTYGFRYEMKGITTEQRNENIQIWRDFYRFVAKSTDEEFYAGLSDWVILDSMLYFYLFTERYTMIDNRAKNTFWHYAKCEDEKYRFDMFNYDNDTALGINNSGEMTMAYGKEDIDYKTDGDPSSGYIFNAAESKFWMRIRNLFSEELKTMYVSRESANCWSSDGLINEFDEWQEQFPEELWRLDIERKYLRPYRNGTERFLREMMNGRKKYHRRQFERDQEKYMATKYFGNVAVADQIMFRCNTPVGSNIVVKPDYTLHLTPYSDMYLSVMFGATYRTQVRAKAGKQYDISCPFTTMDDTAVLIYCASRIQSMGDISAAYIHDNDFSKAEKLQELIIGNTTSGYTNTFLTTLGIGNNSLLKRLDIRNTPNLTSSVDLSGCENLTEFYADNSGITGVTFADGGKIETIHLPSISSITMKNLLYVNELKISDYGNIIRIVIENSPSIDSMALINSATSLKRLRVTGIEWTTEDTWLKTLLALSGVDASGYETTQSVVAGTVHLAATDTFTLEQFNSTWQDLTIDVPGSAILQAYTVTFRNPSIDPVPEHQYLDVQHIIEGRDAVDPITREDSPIDTPTMVVYLEDGKTISTDYTFREWDLALTNIRGDRVITALYDESVHMYTARFKNIDGTILQQTTAPYGSTVEYTEGTPTYTKQESAYVYNLFKKWNIFPYVTGDIDIEAEYDTYRYNDAEMKQMSLSEMTPVQIYAAIKNKDKDTGDLPFTIHSKDAISFTMGDDFDYENVSCTELFPDGQRTFTGVKGDYYDTGISLLDEDTDWVLAVDYKWGEASNNTVLMQCYQSISSDGFRMRYSNGSTFNWGSSSVTASSSGIRDMIVLRHVKGETRLHVYLGNQPYAEISYKTMAAARATTSNSATLIFGAARSDDGILGSYGKGTIYSARYFNYDIGDTACRQMALWTRETITAEMSGQRKYYLSDNSGARCNLTFLMSHLLSNKMAVYSGSNNGGWGKTDNYKILQNRFYNAIPTVWRQLIKECKIGYNTGYTGSGSNETNSTVEYANAYVTLPSILELDSSYLRNPYELEAGEPDDEGNYTIDYIVTTANRLRQFEDGTNGRYTTRSAYPQYSYTWWSIVGDGEDYNAAGATDCWNGSGSNGICLEFSI